MATSDKYKRGSSGYSIEDEKQAKRYAGYERTISQDALNRKNAGEKGFPKNFDQDEVNARVRSSERNYKDALSTEEGRQQNKKNMDFQESEALKVRETNSRAQYEHEKAQGGAMTDLSYEEWKKL
jgi:hypothetical protein